MASRLGVVDLILGADERLGDVVGGLVQRVDVGEVGHLIERRVEVAGRDRQLEVRGRSALRLADLRGGDDAAERAGDRDHLAGDAADVLGLGREAELGVAFDLPVLGARARSWQSAPASWPARRCSRSPLKSEARYAGTRAWRCHSPGAPGLLSSTPPSPPDRSSSARRSRRRSSTSQPRPRRQASRRAPAGTIQPPPPSHERPLPRRPFGPCGPRRRRRGGTPRRRVRRARRPARLGIGALVAEQERQLGEIGIPALDGQAGEGPVDGREVGRDPRVQRLLWITHSHRTPSSICRLPGAAWFPRWRR